MDKKIYVLEDLDGDWAAFKSYDAARIEALRRYIGFLRDITVDQEEIINDLISLDETGCIDELFYIHSMDYKE